MIRCIQCSHTYSAAATSSSHLTKHLEILHGWNRIKLSEVQWVHIEKPIRIPPSKNKNKKKKGTATKTSESNWPSERQKNGERQKKNEMEEQLSYDMEIFQEKVVGLDCRFSLS